MSNQNNEHKDIKELLERYDATLYDFENRLKKITSRNQPQTFENDTFPPLPGTLRP